MLDNFDIDNLKECIKDSFAKSQGFEGICYRGVWRDYANQFDLVCSVGSFLTGGRYNREGSFGVLYMACDPKTCIEELVHSIYNSPSQMAEGLPRMLVSIRVKLSKILRLNKEYLLDSIKINKSVLVNHNWMQKQLQSIDETLGQLIGRTARENGFEGILVPSARWDGCNLNVFPDNLKPDSKLEIMNVKLLNTPKIFDYKNHRDSTVSVVEKRIGKKLASEQEKSLFFSLDNLSFY